MEYLIGFQDSKAYVNTILEVHKKYNALVLTAFNNDSGFVAALDKACGRFINANAVTKQANTSSKSPELLAKYCDLLLKKSSKNPEEAELEDTLNQVVCETSLFTRPNTHSRSWNTISNVCLNTYGSHIAQGILKFQKSRIFINILTRFRCLKLSLLSSSFSTASGSEVSCVFSP